MDEGEGKAKAATVVADDDGVDSSFITMPALSSTMTEGKVVQWLVKEGEKVICGGEMMSFCWAGDCVVVNFLGNIELTSFID